MAAAGDWYLFPPLLAVKDTVIGGVFLSLVTNNTLYMFSCFQRSLPPVVAHFKKPTTTKHLCTKTLAPRVTICSTLGRGWAVVFSVHSGSRYYSFQYPCFLLPTAIVRFSGTLIESTSHQINKTSIIKMNYSSPWVANTALSIGFPNSVMVTFLVDFSSPVVVWQGAADDMIHPVSEL